MVAHSGRGVDAEKIMVGATHAESYPVRLLSVRPSS
jgi:hypothetical protein